MRDKLYLLTGLLVLMPFLLFSQEKEKISEELFSGINARCIGPSVTGGRISDFAVDPNDHSRYFVAVSCGNVWKTTTGSESY